MSGGLLSIYCPTADQPNPFQGEVIFDPKFYLPIRDGEYKGQRFGPIDWISLRLHLAALGNLAAAGRALSVELTFERPAAPFATKVVSWLYGFLSNYGNSIGRPILFLILSWFVGLSIIASSAGARLAQRPEMYLNWKGELVGSDVRSDFLRVALLSLEPVLPLGLFRREPLVEPATFWLSFVQAVQSYLTALLLFLLALAIRRKFRIGGDVGAKSQ